MRLVMPGPLSMIPGRPRYATMSSCAGLSRYSLIEIGQIRDVDYGDGQVVAIEVWREVLFWWEVLDFGVFRAQSTSAEKMCVLQR